jgi:hypothetical protein
MKPQNIYQSWYPQVGSSRIFKSRLFQGFTIPGLNSRRKEWILVSALNSDLYRANLISNVENRMKLQNIFLLHCKNYIVQRNIFLIGIREISNNLQIDELTLLFGNEILNDEVTWRTVTWYFLISKIFKLEPFFVCEKGWNFSNV